MPASILKTLHAAVLDMMKGLAREKNWREHVVQGAKAMTLRQVREILNAAVLIPGKVLTFDYEALRNKSLAIVLLLHQTTMPVPCPESICWNHLQGGGNKSLIQNYHLLASPFDSQS